MPRHMKRRSVRPSTLEATQSLEEKTRIRKEIQEAKQKSAKYSELISLEEKQYFDEVEAFGNLVESIFTEPTPPGVETAEIEPSSAEASELSTTTNPQLTSTREESDNSSAESDSQFEDPLHAVKSPRQGSDLGSPVSLFPTRDRSDSENWSTINQFFPAGCAVTPRLEYREPPPSSSSQVHTPKLVLSTVVEEPVPAALIEAPDQQLAREVRLKPPLPPAAPNMDTFKEKIGAVNKLVKKIDRRIDTFTPADLTVVDKDTFKAYLDDTRSLLDKYLEINDDIIDALDNEDPRNENLKKLRENEEKLTLKYRQNAKDMKEKMSQLLTSRPLTAAEASSLDTQKQTEAREKEKEAKVAENRKKKCEVKMKNTVKKSKDIKDILGEVKDVDTLSENEIRQYMLESKNWERKTDELTKSKEAIDEEFVGDAIDQNLKEEFETEYESTIEMMTSLIKSLTLKDKERGLFSLAPSKSKEKVIYPDHFTGVMGENVYKFCKDIKEAIEADQVRTADQVKTFRKYLKGDAKLNVGEHHSNLEEAMEALVAAYGNPHLIWTRLKDNLFKKISSPTAKDWGREDSVERLNAINRVMDFLKHAHSLAKEYQQLQTDVYHTSTIEDLKAILPHTYWRRWKERIGQKTKPREVLTRLEEVMEEEKDGTLTAIQYTKDSGSRRNDDELGDGAKQPYSRSSRSNNTFSDSSRHYCKDSPNCKREWGFFGCVELYKIQKESERREYISKSNGCQECGSFPLPAHLRHKGHKCFFTQEKYDIRCIGVTNDESCKSAAALCSRHKDNASPVLRAWLAKHNIKFTVGMIMLTSPTTNPTPDSTQSEVSIEEFINFADIVENTSSLAEKFDQYKKIKIGSNLSGSVELKDLIEVRCRELLQKGTLSRMMDNEELVEFFTADMRKKKIETSVLPIPAVDPVFIFCTFQGKTKPIMVFIDSGANCWLSLDGIPQTQLDSVKLAQGPIPLGVASGMTVNAEAEWASLIPLADNTSQIVRGLTMEVVTGECSSST